MAATVGLLVPSLVRNCAWFGSVLRRFETAEREVWLTVDDGPEPSNTPEMLDVLGSHGVRATFFMVGRRVREFPGVVRAVAAAGHSVQNHTQNHREGWFWAALPGEARAEIVEAGDAIEESAGVRPTQFRCPVGLANPFVHAAAEEAGLRMVGWSACGRDGIAHDPDQVVARVLGRVRAGSIILMHESQTRGLRPGVRAQTLERVLKGLRERGFRVTVPVV
jgi:peptidoglycan/xylan/chitin deacetylase (PgdA/CDA1 family)